MGHNQSDYEFETERLAQTIIIAEHQLSQARQQNEENKSSIFGYQEGIA